MSTPDQRISVEPQKRKRCDSDDVTIIETAPHSDASNTGHIVGDTTTVATKRPAMEPDTPDSPDEGASKSSIDDDELDDGELDDDADADNGDCILLEKSIPVIVLDSDLDDVTPSQAAPVIHDPVIDSDVYEIHNSEPLDQSTGAVRVAANTDPLMRIAFRDVATAEKLCGIVQRAIRNALLQQQIAVDVRSTVDHPHELQVVESVPLDGNESVFIIDAAPSVTANYFGASSKSNAPLAANVPQYEINVSDVYDPNTLLNSVDGQRKDQCRRVQALCFNCSGEHNMRDCTEPRNAQRIRDNRQNFGGGMGGRPERYHVDANQKYGLLEPGVISAELRAALGLRAGDLPLHVYRMRMLGYPPAWLEMAQVSHSGLSLFGDATATSAHSSQNSGGEDNIDYDLKKIISYPGFNVQPDEGTLDVSYNLRMPPMQHHQSRTFMLQKLRSKSTKSYKRQKLSHTIPTDMANVDLSNPTMDIDDDVVEDQPCAPPTPQSPSSPTPPPPPPPPPRNNDDDADDEPSRERIASPTLDDLRQQQEKLMAALDDSSVLGNQSLNSTATAVVADDSLIDDILALDASQSCSQPALDDDSQCSDNPPTNDTTLDESHDDDGTNTATAATQSPAVTPLNSSIASVSGTPLLQSSSPYAQPPSGAAWSVGVSDIIDYENLADSTGTFTRMKGVLEKVRVAVKQLNDEYD